MFLGPNLDSQLMVTFNAPSISMLYLGLFNFNVPNGRSMGKSKSSINFIVLVVDIVGFGNKMRIFHPNDRRMDGLMNNVFNQFVHRVPSITRCKNVYSKFQPNFRWIIMNHE